MANFKAYCLSDTIIKSLNRQGYLSATSIQDLVIPKALKGNSLVVKSETGSGKTHSFIVPILQKINVDINKLQAVIVSPTRELAKQTFDFFKEFCAEMPKLSVKLISSVDERTKSVEEMSKNPQIIVATIGRLHEMLVKSSFLPLDDVKFIVLDEADMLLESGFMDDVDSVITKVGAPQLLVFSATISQSLQYILSKYIQADFFITNDSTGNTSKNVKHYGIDIKHKPIEDAVLEFLRVKPAYMILIFVSKKEDMQAIYKKVAGAKFKTCLFNGDLSARERKSLMRRIKTDEFQVIIASDIVARGLDIPAIDVVLSVDLPNNEEFYYHRAGRCGRYDRPGESYFFYNVETVKKVKKLIEDKLEISYLKFGDNELVEGKAVDYKKIFKSKKNEELDQKIWAAKSKVNTRKVKPGYKRKIKTAVDKVKKEHRREVIKKDIRRQIEERNKAERGNRSDE